MTLQESGGVTLIYYESFPRELFKYDQELTFFFEIDNNCTLKLSLCTLPPNLLYLNH